MARPTGTNVARELMNKSFSSEDKSKKYRKEIIWESDMKDILESEAKKRGMTVSGFVKYCVMKEINK